jgi:hypothetical protein
MRPNHHWIFPDAVSDETAVALSMFLYDLASECERRYLTQLRRYRAAQLNLFDPDCPWKRPPRTNKSTASKTQVKTPITDL